MNHLHQPRTGCVWLGLLIILALALLIILASIVWNSPTT